MEFTAGIDQTVNTKKAVIEDTSPKVIVMSWVHGNETSWIEANKQLAQKISNKEIEIIRWQLTLVLEANVLAIKEWTREVQYNMNRLFKDDLKTNWYETTRAKELMQMIKLHDYLLDLHSTSGPSIAFAYAEENALKLAQNSWIWHIISGWGDLANQDWWDVLSWDTENYMNMNWWVWITFEAWNHDNPNWAKEAYRVLLNFLVQTWTIDQKHFIESKEEKKHMKIVWFYKAVSDNFKYSIDIENFKRITIWTEIARDNGIPVYARGDMILIMPKAENVIVEWKEAFFIWREI